MTTQPNDPLAPIRSLLDDPDILEILIDGHEQVYVERHGMLEDVTSPFETDEQLVVMIRALAAQLGRQVNESTPMIDLRLFDGARFNAVLPPISLSGPQVTLRKMMPHQPTFEDLVGWGALTEPMITFLRACVDSRMNMIISGGIGSGKTTVMNLVAGMIPDGERVIVVENAAELQLSKRRVIRLESRPANIEGKGEVSIRDLLVNALRMRPDRIIVGEARGAEVLDFIQAMNTGHDGSMTSIYANGIRDVLGRLEMMATYAEFAVPLLTIRKMIAAAIDIITYQERMQDGSRKMLKIAEVVGMQGEAIEVQDIFEFRRTGMKEGRVNGHFTATGQIPRCLDRIRAAGIDLPLDLFTPS